MDIIRLAISKPVGVAVAVILLVMFGLIGLGAIPVQLSPNVDEPIINVTTGWPGRSPEEIVDRITKEQEEVLKNVENLKSMRSTTSESGAGITLEFYLGTDIDRARQEVSDALRRVPDYPEDVTEPVIQTTEGSDENALAWIMIELPPDAQAQFPDFEIATLLDEFDREVKPFLERIPGVAKVNIFGGRPRELRVLVDPVALAQRGITYGELISVLRSENRNIAAGSVPEGKRDFRVRVMGKYTSPEDVLRTVIAYRDGKPVHVSDVAQVELGFARQRGFVRSVNGDSLAMNVIRQTDANVKDLMAELKIRLAEVQRDIVPYLHPEVGPYINLRQVYDETTYIDSAISLVTQNLWIGGAIAAGVLLIFLRSFVATGVIALAIPISIIGTFLVLLGLGRTLNVVSLAGLAFAVGMVVDNAIVVLENIDRRRGMGEGPVTAAYRGGREVFGAILAATLTTVAVFIPVLTIEEEAGQLFRDISLAIVASVTLSLIISITVIPSACALWLPAHTRAKNAFKRGFQSLFGLAPLMARVVDAGGNVMLWLMTGWRAWTLRPAIIVLMTVASLLGAYSLMPAMDYLPAGNRNLVFGGLLIPPGYSLEQTSLIADRIETEIRPYYEAGVDDSIDIASLPPIQRRSFTGEPVAPFEPVAVENYFIGSFDGGMFIGATSNNEDVVIPIGQLATNSMGNIPDAFGGASQASLFGRGIGGGNSINIEISGPNLDQVTAAAGMMMGLAGQRYGYGDVRPNPANFNLAQPEWQIRVTDVGLELGLRPDSVGQVVRGLVDGVFVADYSHNGENIDMVVLPIGGRLSSKEQIRNIPIVTPQGSVLPVDALVEVSPAAAPQSIQRIEELPSVTIGVTPPKGEALETVMRDIREHVIKPTEEAGMLGGAMRVRLEGTAAKLDEVRASLIGRPSIDGQLAPWQRAVGVFAAVIAVIGAAVGAFALIRSLTRRDAQFAYGAVGALLLGLVIAGAVFLFGAAPELMTARMVWALLVTYLLMCALFESFLYPLVIMFVVPLAIVGGFIGLSIVHSATAKNPLIATQQLDVLTMLGFVILIGVVVNNAILIVHQSLNFMRGFTGDDEGAEPLPPLEAIAAAVRARMRPIFMSALTSVGGMLPLVLFPGAGSELYRGLGSVVVGGLLVSTVFTLILCPLLFSLVLQMSDGLKAALSRRTPVAATATAQPTKAPKPKPQPELEPV